ncbi:MAG: hypothetical protein ACE5JX_15035 [Acidobacteriota bacterium]
MEKRDPREEERRRQIAARVRQQQGQDYRNRRLLAIYDFIDLPFSFDICTFLVNAELRRRQSGCDKIDVAFVCHASDPGPPRHPYVNRTNFREYLYNLGLESTRLLDTVGSVFVFDNRKLFIDFLARFRDGYSLYPRDYDPSLPIELRSDRPAVHMWKNSAQEAISDPTLLHLRAPPEQVAWVRKWILGHVYPKVPVAITLREWEGWAPLKNSSLPEWQRLIDSYRDSRIQFIVLRDYYKLYQPLPLCGENVVYYNEPVLLVSLRAALYQESSLSLFSSGGFNALAWFNRKTRYITFKVTVDDRAARIDDLWSDVRLRPGDDFHGATPYQKLVWEADDFATLRFHVDKMLERLERDHLLLPGYYPS